MENTKQNILEDFKKPHYNSTFNFCSDVGNNVMNFTALYLHFPLTYLRWTSLDQLASYIDEGQGSVA